MSIGRTKLYKILLVACAAGYIWLFISMNMVMSGKGIGVCLIKHTTGIPCPSCGSTRAVLALAQGNFLQALRINPFGLIIASIMLMTPIWIFIDIVTRKSTLLEFYKKTEQMLKKPYVAISLILLVVLNWIWNIIKGI